MSVDPDFEITLYQITRGRWVCYARSFRWGVEDVESEVHDTPEEALAYVLARMPKVE